MEETRISPSVGKKVAGRNRAVRATVHKFAVVTANSSGKILSVNRAASMLFGYPKQALLGKNVSVLMGRPYREQHDDYLKRYKKTREPRVLGKMRVVEGLTSEGVRIRLKMSLSEVKTVTAQDEAEHTYFIAMFERYQDQSCRLILDGEGKILLANGNYWGLLGYEKRHLNDRHINVVFPPVDAAWLQANVRQTKNMEAKHKSGTSIHVSLQINEGVSEKFLVKSERARKAGIYTAVLTPVEGIKAVVTISDKGVVLSCTEEFRHLFGYDANELVGQNISVLSKDSITRFIGGNSVQRTILAVHKDGSVFSATIQLEKFVPSHITDAERASDKGLDKDTESSKFYYRASIARVGKKKATDKEGRELVSEGEYLGHYTYQKALGFGYFGQVREAIHRLTGEKVAIKTLRKKQYLKAKMEYPPREVTVMEHLNHAKICRLYDKIVLDDRVHLVLEYVPGRELCDIVEHESLPEDLCRYLWRQLLLAVEYMHDKNIVHRDLKLENMMVDENNQFKLIDMGFGQFFKPGSLLSTFCGSPDYAAPELFRGIPYDGPKVDIWSLGVVLFAMLSGCLPFLNTQALLAGKYQFPECIRPEARDLISMILNPSPQSRPDIKDLLNHHWTNIGYEGRPFKIPPVEKNISDRVLEECSALGLNKKTVLNAVEREEHNNLTATYYLLEGRVKRNLRDSGVDIDAASKPDLSSASVPLLHGLDLTRETRDSKNFAQSSHNLSDEKLGEQREDNSCVLL